MTKKLADALRRDDAAEAAGMPADDRRTCWTHQTWAEECEERHVPLTAGRALAEALEADRIRDRRTTSD
ncbi:hypothetical protein ACQEVS_33035 [Streptomyces sp. CA-181903]|uniref:hypothetical protein n=1 Tax=Streptomyces sp. CA-181903 TaxID=3240055 RepID=UPI003D8AD0C8